VIPPGEGKTAKDYWVISARFPPPFDRALAATNDCMGSPRMTPTNHKVMLIAEPLDLKS